MAYTKSPELQTHSTERISAVHTIGASTNTSSFTHGMGGELLNLIPMKTKDENGQEVIVAETRDAIVANQFTTSTGIVRGGYVWEKASGTIYYFAVCGQSVYSSTDGLTWTLVLTLATSGTGQVGFTEFIDSVNAKSLILVDGVSGYVFTTNSAYTQITDPDFPTPHAPFPVFIDGYIFLAKSGTGDIYNCTLNTPLSWTAGDFISSELYPDDVVALAKINNNLLAIGKIGCEFYQDAGNATGTPLARIEGGSLPFGCSHVQSIAMNRESVTFLANDGTGASLKTIEGFKFKDITPPWLMQRLKSYADSANFGGVDTEFLGHYINQKDGTLYVLNLTNRVYSPSPIINQAFAYSFSTGYWVKLSGTSLDIANDYWPVFYTCAGSSRDPTTFVMGQYREATRRFGFFGVLGKSMFNRPLGGWPIQNAADDFGPGNDGGWIKIRVTTPEFDFGTLNRKTMSKFRLGWDIFDDQLFATTIAWDDIGRFDFDNSQTINPAFGEPDITYNNIPFITQLGSFRKRAFQVTATSRYPTIVRYFEVEINKGQQ